MSLNLGSGHAEGSVRSQEIASTAIKIPVSSPWILPTAITQASTSDGRQDDTNDSDLDQSLAVEQEDYGSEIRSSLAQDRSHTSINEDGETALHLAAKHDTCVTQRILSRGCNVDIRNMSGETPLMCAINAKNKDTITLLLNNNADVNATDNQQATCLHLAALKDETGSIIQLLLRRKPDIERMNDLGLTPLFLAAFSGNDAVVRWLLLFGAKSETKEADRYGALHYACMQANHDFMDRLLDSNGPDFEAFYDNSTYDLTANLSHSTTTERRIQLVRSLIDHGADIHASRKGFTPLHIATLTAQEPIVNILLSKGAKATGIPVITAYFGLAPEMVDRLLNRGASVSAVDSRWNKTALTWTAEIGSPDTLEILLGHRANLHHQDVQGSSALHYAAANARSESVELLLAAKADPNLLDKEGRTSLIRLASATRFYLAGRWWDPSAAERKKTATLLLDAGCDPAVKDKRGNLAVHYAAGNGYHDILEVIEESGG